jgi:hypothetical protein
MNFTSTVWDDGARTEEHAELRQGLILPMAIGVLLIGQRFLPVDLPALVLAEPGAQIVAGVAFGLCIGTAGTFLGVAGGELLISTLIFIFGADIRTAGSTVLFVSIPTECMGAVPLRPHGAASRPRDASAHRSPRWERKAALSARWQARRDPEYDLSQTAWPMISAGNRYPA